MGNEKNLDINSTPNLLDKEINDSGVKKLNKGPIIFISLALILVLMGLFYAAMQRGIKHTDNKEEKNVKNIDNGGVEKMLSELDQTVKKEPTAKVEKIYLTRDNETKNKDQLKVKQKPQLTEEQKEVIRLKRQLALKALTGPTQLNLKTKKEDILASKNNQSSMYSPNMFANANNKNATVRGNEIFNKYMEKISGGNKPLDNNKRNQEFLDQKTSYDYLGSKKTPLLSPYEIKTGTLIPSVLITGANSDLPGKITGQVRENVYDTATGEYLLIPQGTRLVGEYSANVIYGQERLLVAWNRLIFPDGQTLNLGKMLGTAADGYTGFHDEVDNHYIRIFGSAILMSAISAGVQLSQGEKDNQYVETNTDKAIGGAIQQLGQVGTEMIRKNMDISPTLNIRPGYRFNIFVTKDIILEPLGY